MAAIGTIRARDIRLIEWEPTAWLIRQLKSSDALSRTAAFDEVLSRLNRSKLSDAQIKKIADVALAAQGDLSTPWWPNWGDLLDLAHRRSKLSPEQWNQYLRQSIVLELRTRKTIYGNNPIPVQLLQKGRRLGRTSKTVQIQGSWAEIHVGGATFRNFSGQGLQPPPEMTFPTINAMKGWQLLSTENSVALFGTVLPNGKQKISVTFHAIISEGNGVKVWPPSRSRPPLTLNKVDIELSADVIHLPEPAAIEMERDPSKGALVKASFGTPPIRVWGWDNHVAFAFDIDRPPVDLAFDVVLRADGIDWRVGSFAARSGEHFSAQSYSVLNGFTARQVDIVLRPSAETALCTIDVERIWGQEIVLPGISVEQSAFLGKNEIARPAAKPLPGSR